MQLFAVAGDCPVSYTHLDVYKRQLICCVVDFGIAQFGLLNLIQKAYSGIAYLAIPVILIPVSYTHLDVYKRQALGHVLGRKQVGKFS